MDSNHQPEDEHLLTVQEYIQRQEFEQRLYSDLLSRDESKTCSFSKGYIDQQLYGCKTCSVQMDKQMGFCLGCYLNCHLEHDTFEIGIKRGFRCDCNHDSCQLYQKKEQDDNQEQQKNDNDDQEQQKNDNQYDQNFDNRFCKCKQTYDENEFMIHCNGCLDFYHLYHLGLDEDEQNMIMNNEHYCLMLCPDCIRNKYYILVSYLQDSDIVHDINQQRDAIESQNQIEEKIQLDGQKRKRQEWEQNGCKVKKVFDKDKILENYDNKPLFMVANFQQKLCGCYDCLKLNNDLQLNQIQYLQDKNAEYIDQEYDYDYEPLDNNQQIDSMLENLMKQYDHMTQCNIAYQINELRQKMVSFLQQQSEKDKVVTKEDVLPLIQELQKNKRKRVE